MDPQLSVTEDAEAFEPLALNAQGGENARTDDGGFLRLFILSQFFITFRITIAAGHQVSIK